MAQVNFFGRRFWKVKNITTSGSCRGPWSEQVYEPAEQDTANLVGSTLPDGMHAPVIELDVPAYLVPSSTPGHSHVYINVAMPWPRYRIVLWALRRAGVIGTNYYHQCAEMQQSFVRPPGVTKDNDIELSRVS